MALGTPVAGAAAYGGTTTVTPAYPAGILATDAVLLFVGQKPSTANGGTVTTPTGWTLREELTAAGGYGTTLGADTGNTNLRVYSWNTPVAGQTGNLTVTLGTNNSAWAFMVRIPTGGGAPEYGSADGQRTTAPTVNVAFATALTNGASATNFQSGDLAIWAMCIPTDVTTPGQFSAQSVTATGATFATAVELNEPDSQTGNDIGGYSAYASVSSGSSTTAPTVTVTAGGTVTNVRGPIGLLRVREGAAPQTLTPTLYTNTQTFHNPTVTPGAVALTPSLYTNDQTFYSPDVTQGGGTQALTPSLYTNTQTFFAATVTATKQLLPSLYTNGQTFYAATVSQAGGVQTITPDLYTNAQTFFAPTVGRGTVTLAPNLYTNTQTFYAPSVTTTATLTPSLYTNTQSFYSATVSQGTTAQELTFEDYVAVDYVEPGYVTWVASFQPGNQFFSPTIEAFAQRGEGWLEYPNKATRNFSKERDEKDELRKTIEQAVSPITAATAKIVTIDDKVAVVTETGPSIAIPVPAAFDAQAVSKMVVSVLQEAGIEAQRVRNAQARKRALIVLQRLSEENARRLRKQRRDAEFLLLM